MLYKTLPGFLGPQLRDELLAYAQAHEASFEDTAVGQTLEVVKSIRMSRRLNDLGRFRKEIEDRVLALTPSLQAELQLNPIEPTGCEIELVAHEDGAFYRRHIDVFTDKHRGASSDRILSVVYYFFREPKPFTGGELRVFRTPTIKNPVEEHVDWTPENDCAVAFSTWTAHEVRAVQCPSRQFADARFAVNCWVLRAH